LPGLGLKEEERRPLGVVRLARSARPDDEQFLCRRPGNMPGVGDAAGARGGELAGGKGDDLDLAAGQVVGLLPRFVGRAADEGEAVAGRDQVG
jgi:hypothetical protein